jgi:hypothetical protein
MPANFFSLERKSKHKRQEDEVQGKVEEAVEMERKKQENKFARLAKASRLKMQKFKSSFEGQHGKKRAGVALGIAAVLLIASIILVVVGFKKGNKTSKVIGFTCMVLGMAGLGFGFWVWPKGKPSAAQETINPLLTATANNLDDGVEDALTDM